MNTEGGKDQPPKEAAVEPADPTARQAAKAVGALNYTTDEKDEGTGEEWVRGPGGKMIKKTKGA